MSVSSDEYEKFVATIIDGVKSSGRAISKINYGRNNKFRGISGQDHQIDVSFIDHSFSEPTLILIECKRYDEEKYPIELDTVKVLKATLDDVAQNFDKAKKFKAIFVTTAKARSGAVKYANYYDIIIEKLPHSKNFTFKYESIISVGMSISAGQISFGISAKLIRRCEKCGKQFEMIGEEKVCPDCEAASNIK